MVNTYEGETYNADNLYSLTSTEKPTIPDNYEFKEKTTNYTGTVGTGDITVIYYYQKKNSQITSTIT